MTQNVNPTFVKVPNIGVTQITTGTGANGIVTVYSGGVNGSKITSLIGVSAGTTSAFDVHYGIQSGSSLVYYLGTASVPVNSGIVSGTPAVSFLNTVISPGVALDSDGNPYVILPSSAWSLVCTSPATSSAWTTGAVIQLTSPNIGDF